MPKFEHAKLYFTIWMLVQILLVYYVLLSSYIYIALIVISYVLLRQMTETDKETIQVKGQGILITGCDTGFGHETALQYDKLGFTVFAGCLLPDGDGARKLQKTGSKRMHVLQLDVTKEEHVNNAVSYITRNCPKSGLWAVVNNAAINRCCDIELASIDLIKKVAEVNFYGMVRVTKAFVNMLRTSGGRVINVTSVRGRVALPSDVSYTTSKWAGEAFSDILRREVDRFGIKVVIVEPGNFGGITGMLNAQNIKNMEQELLSAWESSPADTKRVYGKQYIETLLAGFRTVGKTSHETVQPVIDAMVDAVTNTYPKYRYLVPGGNKFLDWYSVAAILNPLLPEVIMDFIVRVVDPQPPVAYNVRQTN